MTDAVAAIAAPRPVPRAGLSVSTLTAVLLGLFAADNLLLLHFWGLPLALSVGLIFIAATAVWALCSGASERLPKVPVKTLVIASLVATAIFALGGEGRFFYANTDWQVRDAVLRDMASNPWPFAYDVNGTGYFLRAPLGTYLLPAMFGASAEVALLASNALRLTLLLALGSHLFANTRERTVGLIVFLLFSGWDVVGTAINSALGIRLSWDHLEQWNFGYQYSSHLTQAFWVPQHAIAGWTCAVVFMLWRRGLVPIGPFAASIPLVAIWSPLAIMGAVPFAIFAGIDVLRRRDFERRDIALALLALAVSLPALLYLQVDAASVGMHLLRTNVLIWLLCIGLEVLPFTVPLLLDRDLAHTDRSVVRLVQFLLLAMPLVQVGISADFQMRASIMPLAMLAILFAQWVCRISAEAPLRAGPVAYAAIAVALGAATPLLEVRRAVVNQPSPSPRCSLVGVWDRQVNTGVPNSTYLAPVSKLPGELRSIPVTTGGSDPDKCWDRNWDTPRR